MTITIERLREILHYDPEAGTFTWLKSNSTKGLIGKRAGYVDAHQGYRRVNLGGKCYREQRLAWFYMKGEWPIGDVDHIDGNKSDNRWINLRQATRSQNMCNKGVRCDSKSGLKGISSSKKRWTASIQVNGKLIYLGSCATPEEAHRLYGDAAQKYHGEFARSK